MKKSCYTPNLVEPIRLEIGRALVSHEVIKLFPNHDYEELKIQVDDKWKDFINEVAIRDFWNMVDSLMMGFRLKNIIKDITSQYYSWTLEKKIQIDELRFTDNMSGLPSNGKTASEIKEFLKNDRKTFQRIVDIKGEKFPENDKRHMDPAVVLKNDNKLFVHDGNGRLLKVIVEGGNKIDAYVGVKKDATKPNYWVPTSYLMMLFDEVRKNSNYAGLLLNVLRESDNAVYEFKQRVRVASDEDKQLKKEIISKL